MELDTRPNAPALRNAVQEARLATRIQSACEARRNRDWHALYLFSDPRDRPQVPEEQFTRAESLVEYLSCKLDCVEVIGGRGRVCIAYKHRLADPSLSKLPAESVTVIEPWTLFDNEWFRDLDNPVH